MQLITNVYLSKGDVRELEKAVSNKEKEVIAEIENITDELKKNHIKMLGWLLKKGLLEIKVSCMIDPRAIEHQKFGILEDEQGDKVAFYGSDNETKYGWLYHNESFHVARSWEAGEIDHLAAEIENFDILWTNKTIKTRVYPISEALKNSIIRLAPHNDDELSELTKETAERLVKEYRLAFQVAKPSIKQKPALYDFQKEAVNAWLQKGRTGIIAMATGTGKTYVGCACIDEVINKEKKVGVVIVAPQEPIVNQWIGHDLLDFQLFGETVFGTSKRQLDRLMNKILDVKNGRESYFIIGTSYDTFCKEEFTRIISSCDFPLLLIADEVHAVGTAIRENGLLSDYTYRLGLSATPRRRDERGTEIIYDYFYRGKFDEKIGDTFIFSLSRAIREKYLTEYSYYPYVCELTDVEYNKYSRLSKQLSQAYAIAKQTNDYAKYEHLTNIRKDIIKNAENKISVCERIIGDLKQLDHCLFFLDSERQIDRLCEILDKKFPNITYKIFTSRQLPTAKEKMVVLMDFDTGRYPALLSIGCFNEGINVKSTRTAFFVASSTNPREFIQRRGRVLRISPGKVKATIFDIIVVPPKGKIQKYGFDSIATSLVKPEIERFSTFYEDCDNQYEALNKSGIKDILSQSGLGVKNG